MLALKDRNHICRATVPALAKICNITNEDCESYLERFQEPDKYSRSQEHEGRRIERVEGGYLILNGDHYQALLSKQERQEYKNEKGKEYRRQKKTDEDIMKTDEDSRGQKKTPKIKIQTKTKKETKTKTEEIGDEGSEHGLNGVVGDGLDEVAGNGKTDRVAKPTRPNRSEPDSDFLEGLKENQSYRQIDILNELGKAQTWCAVNHRVCTRRFFVNWLNRSERPIGNQPVVVSGIEIDSSRFSTKTRGNAAVMARFIEEGKLK